MKMLWQIICLVLLFCFLGGALGAILYEMFGIVRHKLWRMRKAREDRAADEALFEWLSKHMATEEPVERLADIIDDDLKEDI